MKEILLLSASRTLASKSPAIPEVKGQPGLIPVSIKGAERLNSLFNYVVILNTPDGLPPPGALAANDNSWLKLATYDRGYRIFQDKTPLHMTDKVLSNYHFSIDKRLFDPYHQTLDYTTQYGQSANHHDHQGQA